MDNRAPSLNSSWGYGTTVLRIWDFGGILIWLTSSISPDADEKKIKNLQKSLLSWWKNTLSSPVNICAFYKPVITISCWKLSKFFLLGETEANYIDGIWLIFKEDMWTSLQRVQLTYNNSYGKNNQQYSRAFRLVNIIEVGFL